LYLETRACVADILGFLRGADDLAGGGTGQVVRLVA